MLTHHVPHAPLRPSLHVGCDDVDERHALSQSRTDWTAIATFDWARLIRWNHKSRPFEKGSNGRMFRHFSVRDCTLIAALMMLWSLSTDADTRHLFVVIVPQARQPTPPPPNFPAQPPLIPLGGLPNGHPLPSCRKPLG